MTDAKVWPKELRLSKDKKSLAVSFNNGQTYELTAEFLRVESPSAEVQGHSPDQRKTVPGKRNVEIMAIEPVGRYAVRITFTDLHNTGIYSWDYLHQLGSDHDNLWQRYLTELEEQGLQR